MRTVTGTNFAIVLDQNFRGGQKSFRRFPSVRKSVKSIIAISNPAVWSVEFEREKFTEMKQSLKKPGPCHTIQYVIIYYYILLYDS